MSTSDSEMQRLDEAMRKHRLFKFDPTVSSGTLLQITALLLGGVSAYGVYTSDRKESEMKLQAVETAAKDEKERTKEKFTEVLQKVEQTQASIKETQASVQKVSESVNDIKITVKGIELTQHAKGKP